jgi:hypothetical protein
MSRKPASSRRKKQLPFPAKISPSVAQRNTAPPPQIFPEDNLPTAVGPTDPPFPEIYAQWRERGFVLQEFTSIFAAARYAIKNTDAFKAVLEDPFGLYDVTSWYQPSQSACLSGPRPSRYRRD